MDNAKLKLKAKKSLRKNITPLVIATLIFMIFEGVCYGVANAVSVKWISSLLLLIVEALFLPGFIKMILNASRNKKVKIEEFFSETESFFKYLGLFIVIFLIMFVLGLLAAIDFRSLIAIMYFNGDINLGLSIFLIAFGIVLAVAILLVTIYIAISFSQVLFILVDEPKLSIKEILSKSFDMMENYIVEYFILALSFIGWILLGIITFGILFILVIPYMMLTMAYFYETVKKEYQEYSGEENLVTSEEVKVVKKAASKKAAAKPAAKKTTAKKTSAKPAAKKTATKVASKKPATKATTAKKTTTKKTTTTRKTTATKKPTAKTSTRKTSK